MAVPTISSVTPSTGPAAGYTMVDIVGTNFRVPTYTFAVPAVAPGATVRVAIGGEAALKVEVRTATKLRVWVPQYRGDPLAASHAAVAVVVTNLDDDGVAIAGETVTRVGGYTYTRWPVLPVQGGSGWQDDPLIRVVVELLSRINREVPATAAWTTHVDYGDEGAGEIIDLESIPCVNLAIDFPRDDGWAHLDNGFEEVERDDGKIDRYRGLRSYMVRARLVVAAEGGREAVGLCRALEDSFLLNPYVTVDADPGLYPGERDSYALDVIERPTQLRTTSGAGVVAYEMGLQVRGVQSMLDFPTGRDDPADTLQWTLSNMDGENPDTQTVAPEE